MRYISRGIWIGVLTVSLTSLSLAQSSETGFPAFSSQAGGQWDSVNLANLNVHIAVPIFSRPGRGQKFGYGLSYDSTVYSTTGSIPGTGAWLLGFGWTGIGGGTGTPIEIEGALVGSILLARQNPETCSNQAQGTQTHFLTYIDPNQTAHPFTTEIVLDSCTQTGGTTTTSDDSGYTITIAYATGIATVTNRSGKVMVFPVNGVVSPSSPATVTDTNGNRITFDGTTITDTLGTTPLTASGSYPNPFVYQFPNSMGTTSTITVSYVNPAPAIQTEFQCPGNAFFGPPLEESIPAGQEPLVDKITLPDGSTYQFTYEPTPGQPSSVTGRLASVKVPTGATISYQYLGPNDGVNCNDGTTTTLKRTTSDGTWTYSRVISGANVTTTVTDPQNNQTVINFLGGTETERQIYQGSSASGTLLQTVFTCYNGAKPNCNNTAVTFPIIEVSKFIQIPGAGENEQDTFLDGTTGRIQEMDEYDFGASQPGSLLRKTVVGYAPLGNNISDHPSSMTICKPGGTDTGCGGAGTRVAQTTFAYDESSVTSTSGITQHVAISGSRGNQTSVHRWLNTTGGTLDTANSFDDTGNIVSTTDPGGHISSFTFNACNGAFSTQTSLPDTQTGQTTVHHKTSATYDCNTGLVMTATDQNLNVTKFFYDNMGRPTETDYPDLGQTLISYPDPNHVTVQRKIDSSRSTSSTTVLDGYGRVSRIATANGESTPYDQQDSCYDGNGRLSFRSYIYQGNSSSGTATCPNVSEVGDSFAYDALGRPTQVTHSDGTSSSTTYSGLAIQTTDEGNGSFNVSHIVQNDALGRVTNVCELYSGAALPGNGGTPASCGLNIAATGFLTSYGYDTLDNLISVTQGVLTNRTYAYDSVSRLTSETTPEAGTVSYTYNADSLLATRARPAPNQTNSAVITTTNYQYDPLHRPTGRTYSGDPTNTPAPIFNYDETNVWGMSLTNTIGQISSEAMGVPSNAGQVFSYDPMGRSKLNAQCTPNTCNASPFSPYTLSYQYDLLGDVISAGNGVGVTFTNSFNIAGRLIGTTSSLSDSTHPGTLLSNMHYSPVSVTDTLGNGLLETTGFSPRGLLTSVQAINPIGTNSGAGSVGISGTLQSQTQPGTSGTGWVSVGGSEQTTTTTISVSGSGFETPALGSGANAYQYHPTGSNWTFGSNSGVDANGNVIGGSGLTGNNSGFTSSNPGAPEGSQVAFLQGGSANFISQSLSGFQAGVSYTVSFQAAQRGNFNSGGQDFDVYLDSTLLATFRPASTSYGLLSTPAFTTTAGAHTLKFVGRDSAGGNGNAAFIDAVQITGVVADAGTVTVSINGTSYVYNFGAGDNTGTIAAGLASAINAGSLASATSSANTDVTVANLGFETPGVGAGNFQYSPTGGSWTFGGGTGISANGSGFTSGNPGAPEGSQVAFIQMGSNDVFFQALSGFQTGVSYTVSFFAAQRGNSSNGGEDFDVYLDSTLLGTFRPASTSYATMSTSPFTTTAGTHTLKFVGRDSVGGDNTAFIDAVRVRATIGNTITLTSNATGTGSNYALTTSDTWNSGQFSTSSFTAGPSGSTLTGGQNGPTTYDQGTTTVTVNNHSDSYSWSGSATTSATIAQGLCIAINSDAGSFVYASTNGISQQCPLSSATLSLVARVTGSGTNYSLSTSSTSTLNSFSTTCPGFASCSNASLSGGTTVSPYSFTLGRAPDAQVTSANDAVNSNWTFAYDQFNRLVSSNKNSGQQTFGYVYDRYGNRWQQNAPQGGPAPQYMFDNSNHFIGSGVTFDAAGNVLTDGLGNSFTWDAEGRLIQVKQGSTVTATYSYDADGRRVHGPNGEYVYDLDGHMITQIALNGIWAYGEIYAAGRHLATYSSGTTNFLHGDWLGTKRVMTALNGTTSETCTGLPFGDGVNCVGTNWTFNGFTDDIHDPETNLEHTLFRQYSGTQGRWLAPDPAGLSSVDPMNPQSWNRYSYVTNNPGNAVDPTGMDACDYIPCGFDSFFPIDEFFNSLIDAELYQLGTVLWTDSPMGSLQGPSFGFSGFNVQDILQNILRDAIPIDTCPPGGFECPDDGRPLFGTPSCGPFCVMDATSPTRAESLTCGLKVVGNTILDDINPFQPSVTTPIDPTMQLIAGYLERKAMQHALVRGLTYPLKSSIFRNLLKTAGETRLAAPLLTFDVAAFHGVLNEVIAFRRGDCD